MIQPIQSLDQDLAVEKGHSVNAVTFFETAGAAIFFMNFSG